MKVFPSETSKYVLLRRSKLGRPAKLDKKKMKSLDFCVLEKPVDYFEIIHNMARTKLFKERSVFDTFQCIRKHTNAIEKFSYTEFVHAFLATATKVL